MNQLINYLCVRARAKLII